MSQVHTCTLLHLDSCVHSRADLTPGVSARRSGLPRHVTSHKCVPTVPAVAILMCFSGPLSFLLSTTTISHLFQSFQTFFPILPPHSWQRKCPSCFTTKAESSRNSLTLSIPKLTSRVGTQPALRSFPSSRSHCPDDSSGPNLLLSYCSLHWK